MAKVLKPRKKVTQPQLFLTPEAYADIRTLVQLADKEVGWLGTVKQKDNTYIIEKVYLFEQEVHETETEICPEALGKFFQENIDVANSIRFWGHSHVDMNVSPSGQDNTQMEELMENCEYFIMGIFNKDRAARFDFYSEQIIFEDVDWDIISNNTKQLAVQYKELVSEVKPYAGVNQYAGHSKTQFGNKPTGTQGYTHHHNWGGIYGKQNNTKSSKTGLREHESMGWRQGGGTQSAKSSLPTTTSGDAKSGSNAGINNPHDIEDSVTVNGHDYRYDAASGDYFDEAGYSIDDVYG